VSGTTNPAVVWSASAGTIDADGRFTAPRLATPSSVTVTATSVAENAKSSSATVDVAADLAPEISELKASPSTGSAALTVEFSAAASDPEGDALSFAWDFGDGSTGAGASAIHVYEKAGSYKPTLTVTDDIGLRASAFTTIEVTAAPPIVEYKSRTDAAFVPVPNPMPDWGGLYGINRVNVDPDFNNPILRITDASLGVSRKFCTGLDGSGSVPQIWNADSTILLVCDNGGNYFPVGFDPVNFKSRGPLYGTSPIFFSGPGLFHHRDPNLFFAFSKGKIFTLDYTDRATRPIATLVYDFRDCGMALPATPFWMTIGGSDSDDVLFSAGFSLTSGQGTGYYVAAYNGSNGVCYNLNTSSGAVTQHPGGKVIGTVDIPDRFRVHNVKMKGATALVVAPQDKSCTTTCSSPPYAWIIGTTQMYALGHPQGSGHWAAGCSHWLNASGNLGAYEWVRPYTDPASVVGVWAQPTPCGEAPLPACAKPFDSHPAWLGDCSDTGPVFEATVAPNDNVVRPLANEILGYTTDGTNKQWRFAHTYATVALQNFNGAWAIGGPSPDGRFYAWTTSAGGQFGCSDGSFACALNQRRTDVLVVKLQ
jgi:PKD repeat protein